ncbi:MAG: chemotaxis protein CheA [Magnetococcales bacterium]|nr:chemotaxis protein CheA [Magnetococcales bacterium]
MFEFDEETRKALLEEFFSESREALGRIERGLLQLEVEPDNRALLNAVFRDMHTVKGNCRMMGFSRLEALTHSAETLLDQLRDGLLAFTESVSSVLLGVLDSVVGTFDNIAVVGDEGAADFSGQITMLEGQFAVPVHQMDEGEAREELVEVAPPGEDDDLLMDPRHLEPQSPMALREDDPSSSQPEAFPDLSNLVDVDAADKVDTALQQPVAGGGASVPMESVRLSLARLDALMKQVGELGATYNQLKYILEKHPDEAELVLEEHGKLIHTLQDEVLQYRLQPIGTVLQSYQRLVRDLAITTEKKVMLEISGVETEVDRNVLISIRELLGHLVRNAVDHGIESPEVRIEQGKPPVGLIQLSAEQKHGQIVLEIRDDGGGIDAGQVVEKALQRGVISTEQALSLSEQERLKLIMEPGFSTAEEVSAISGRGTGMDVVQAALEKVGGTLKISSEVGAGSTFRLRIPQTMAIVPALLVTCKGGVYAVPQTNIVELLSFYDDEISRNIEGKMQSPMVRMRERLITLCPLQRILARYGPGRSSGRELKRIRGNTSLHVVVLQSEEILFGLEVDEIVGPANLVIKPMDSVFSHITILSGAAVMPDGSVSFLLNVQELIDFYSE